MLDQVSLVPGDGVSLPKAHGEGLPIEQALLGAILFDNGLLDAACAGLDPHHFAEPLHRQLFGLISGMIWHGRKADPRTLNAALSEKTVASNGMTAAQYIARCAAEAADVRPQAVKQYAHEVVLLSWKRDLKERLEDVQALLDKGEAGELITALRETTAAIETTSPVAPKDEVCVVDAGQDTELPPPRPWLTATQFCQTYVSSIFCTWGHRKDRPAVLAGNLVGGRALINRPTHLSPQPGADPLS